MYVFPFIFGYPRWLYLLLFLAFIVAGILFNRFLQHSLRNGPHWGKSPVRRVTPRSAAAVTPPPAVVTPTSRPAAATPTPPPYATARPRPAPSVTSPPVPRFDYCRRYPDLLALCDGSVVRADRLVDLEAKSSPSAAPDVWVNLAISRFPAR
jgi:hypothetical protein